MKKYYLYLIVLCVGCTFLTSCSDAGYTPLGNHGLQWDDFYDNKRFDYAVWIINNHGVQIVSLQNKKNEKIKVMVNKETLKSNGITYAFSFVQGESYDIEVISPEKRAKIRLTIPHKNSVRWPLQYKNPLDISWVMTTDCQIQKVEFDNGKEHFSESIEQSAREFVFPAIEEISKFGVDFYVSNTNFVVTENGFCFIANSFETKKY